MTIRPLSAELAQIAKNELNEDPRRIQDDLQNIKDWIAKQSHLKARTDDQWLVATLRGCKFSLERVKRKLDLYYTLRTTAADVTRRVKPTEQKFLDILKQGACLVLPRSSTLSPRVILLRPGYHDPAKYDMADIICVFYYLAQILLMDDDTATVVGTKVMVDYQGVNLSHLSNVTPALVKKMIVVLQDSMPLRLKGSHHIRMPSSLETIFGVVKSFINEKAKERLKIHKTEAELLEHFPKDAVPAEYGGSGGTIQEITDYWVSKVVEYREWMRVEETLGTDESRRAGAPQTPEAMFGLQGSFRKLELD